MEKKKRKYRHIPIYHHHYFDIICDEVSVHFPVDRAELLGRERRRAVADNRFMVCWLMRNIFSMTLTDIAAMFSRDHSTVIHSLNMVDDWEFANPQRWATLMLIQSRLLLKFPAVKIEADMDVPAIIKDLAVLKAQHKNFGMMIQAIEARLTGTSITKSLEANDDISNGAAITI